MLLPLIPLIQSRITKYLVIGLFDPPLILLSYLILPKVPAHINGKVTFTIQRQEYESGGCTGTVVDAYLLFIMRITTNIIISQILVTWGHPPCYFPIWYQVCLMQRRQLHIPHSRLPNADPNRLHRYHTDSNRGTSLPGGIPKMT